MLMRQRSEKNWANRLGLVVVDRAGALTACEALKANPDLVELRRAERWNGAPPSSIYGSAPIPFLSLPASHPQ